MAHRTLPAGWNGAMDSAVLLGLFVMMILDSHWVPFISRAAIGRRDRLLANPPACPRCDATDVQLRDWLADPATWRCDACGMEFAAYQGAVGE